MSPRSPAIAPRRARDADARAYHHGDLRNALLAHARTMLERDGPEAVSLRAVARAAGVSQTAPYKHFASKDDLLATIAGDGFLELAASQRVIADAQDTAAERLVLLGRDYVGFATTTPQRYRLMFGAGGIDWRAHPPVAEAKAGSFTPVKDVIAEHLAGERLASGARAEVAAIATWALVHGLSMLLVDRTLHADEQGGEHALVGAVLEEHVAGLGSQASRRGAAAAVR